MQTGLHDNPAASQVLPLTSSRDCMQIGGAASSTKHACQCDAQCLVRDCGVLHRSSCRTLLGMRKT
jgi:hypothetical protein